MAQSRIRVLIVGAGPTGCTLALLLARAGMACTLVEKNAAPQPHPAACILSTRTMEVFRELGVADDILQQCQNIFDRANVTWVTSLSGRLLGRSSVMPEDIATLREVSSVHATHFPQNRLEPLLWQRVRDESSIEFLWGHECVGVTEAGGGASALVRAPSGETISVLSDYVVACDGASSPVRRAIGIPATGKVLRNMIGIYFVADLTRFVEDRMGILYWVFNPDVLGVLIAHWLPEEWVLFVPYFPPQQSPEEFSDHKCRALIGAAIGCTQVEVDIRLVRPWVMAASVASHYRRGRVFLAGDAAHAIPPTGGLGLNTGVQDAHNLAWKLAAVLKATASPELLETYEQERRPVAIRNIEQSVRNFWKMDDLNKVVGLDHSDLYGLQRLQNWPPFRRLPLAWQKSVVERILRGAFSKLAVLATEDSRGREVREAFAQRLPDQAPHYRFIGLDLGYRYREGALVPSGMVRADASAIKYRPTTCPGARLPHFWVREKSEWISIHDVLSSSAFTMLVHEVGAGDWRTARTRLADMLPMPVRFFSIGLGPGADLEDPLESWTHLSETGPTGAVLVRPDGHVAWRAPSLPEEPAETLRAVVDTCLGKHPNNVLKPRSGESASVGSASGAPQCH